MAAVKVLTLWQPWASLIALGVKSIETRSWSTQYRGPLAIHASARRPEPHPVGDWLPYSGLSGGWALEHYASGEIGAPPDAVCPLGAIVATCTLVDVVPMVAELGCSEVLGKGPLITVSRAGDHVTGLTWQNTVSPTRYIDKEFCERLRADRPYGLYKPGRYAWLLADVVPVDPPVPFRGGQGLTRTWEPTPA